MAKTDDLKITVSGVRGIVNGSLSETLVKEFSRVFADYIGPPRRTGRKKILIGRDTRQSGQAYKDAIVSALLPLGCEVVDLGVCPTPTVLLMVRELKANGGIIITASHNPARWNGLKFASDKGIFLSEKQINEVITNYKNKAAVKQGKTGKKTSLSSAIETHLEKVVNYLDIKAIKKKKFKVAIDPCNGTGAIITPLLLNELGCFQEAINMAPDGNFAHNPEPSLQNLSGLCSLVKSKCADIGFAQDPDADRLAIVDNNGECLSEEYTLALAADYVLSRQKGNVVVNMSTSRVIDDIAHKYNVKLFRSKVGEANVVEKMIREKAIFGGEGNGGVIFPEINFARDSIAGIGLILAYMAQTGKTISELIQALPQYKILKTKIEMPSEKIPAFLEKIRKNYSGENLDLGDGIKINYPFSWVHVRPSNTEPIVRIISEARTREEAQKLIEEVTKTVE